MKWARKVFTLAALVLPAIAAAGECAQRGVIEPGQKLMDVVPERAPLTIEAKLAITDGDDVYAGRQAFVRFEALHERSLPALKGQVLIGDIGTARKKMFDVLGEPVTVAAPLAPPEQLVEVVEVVEKVSPAVVNISAEQPVRRQPSIFASSRSAGSGGAPASRACSPGRGRRTSCRSSSRARSSSTAFGR